MTAPGYATLDPVDDIGVNIEQPGAVNGNSTFFCEPRKMWLYVTAIGGWMVGEEPASDKGWASLPGERRDSTGPYLLPCETSNCWKCGSSAARVPTWTGCWKRPTLSVWARG